MYVEGMGMTAANVTAASAVKPAAKQPAAKPQQQSAKPQTAKQPDTANTAAPKQPPISINTAKLAVTPAEKRENAAYAESADGMIQNVSKQNASIQNVSAQNAREKKDAASIYNQDNQNTDTRALDEKLAAENEKIRKAIENMKAQLPNSEVKFGIHEKTERVTIKILDKGTKEVIREFPPEKTLDMIAKCMEIAGLLVDEKM